MVGTALKENFETGLFESSDGRRYVRCEFNPEEPVWIDVTGSLWSASHAGQIHTLDWAGLRIPEIISRHLKTIMWTRMKSRAPSFLRRISQTLAGLMRCANSAGVDLSQGFGKVSASSLLSLWQRMSASDRSIFRSLYSELAEKRLAGADFLVAKQMAHWKARAETKTLRGVMEWDEDAGAFTSLEWELIRGALNHHDPSESDVDSATRIFGRIINETLKRPIQVLSMKCDALWLAPSGREFFLRIPKAKGQAGDRPALWQITSELAEAIQEYSRRPEIHALQKKLDRLIVMLPIKGDDSIGIEQGQIPGWYAKARLQAWATRQGIISPRTNRNVNLTPYRIRHTGATAMALQGVPRDEIQEILEHDSPYSADAYIQAVG